MLASFLALLSLGTIAAADLTVYQSGTGALASGWENWSWSTTLDFASTGGPGGVQSISVNSGEWAALSVYAETAFKNNYAGLRFQISGNQPDVSLYLSSSSDSASSVSMPLSSMSTIVNTTAFTEITVDFGNLPGNKGVLPQDSWNLINFQGGQNGATYYLTNVMLLSELVITPEFLSAEPIGNNIIMVTSKGAVDFSKLSVKLNNATAKLTKIESYSPADTPAQTITYFTLSVPLAAGSLSISTGSNTTFSFVIPKLQYGTITIGNLRNISDDIYGMNFPTSADYIKLLGITMSRWGGNAVTAYNPDGAFTNAGNDWYFENRGSSPDDQGWLQFVQDGGSRSIFTIPALDWVAKDGTSYSYPATAYPDQRSFDPYKPDAGDGQFPNGSWVTPLPQTNVYTPWNASMAKSWMQSMKLKPTIITVDNEIEIASSTHQDMHPNPMGYDEELQRVLNIAKAAKSADSNLLVAAPSTCAWWFYWTSEIGYSDNAAHNNQDFLPWFLSQMKSASDAAGERLLDYLDIHYYFGPDTSANDAASKALRLRMTRSFWVHPTYTDESWIGTSVPAQWNEPNPNQVWLIPRFQQLIAQHFPGTKLSISEWSSSAPDGDVTGGLVTADSLGIFGVYGLDSATYWVTADQLSPVGLAYWLFRGNGTYFGNKSIQVNMADSQPDVLGVYASTSDGKKVTMVIVNKDVVPINLAISNIPEGKYFLRHFGGAAGVAKWQTTITIKANSNFVIPAYTAVFFQQQ